MAGTPGWGNNWMGRCGSCKMPASGRWTDCACAEKQPKLESPVQRIRTEKDKQGHFKTDSWLIFANRNKLY